MLSAKHLGFLLLSAIHMASAETHWSFLPISNPSPPSVRLYSWPANAVDAFLLAELEKKGWSPAPLAEPPRWLRRLSFDLRGLPPAWEETAFFLADDHPQRDERQVDRWLASPAFGENLARGWLDLARHADTMGHAADRPRPMWLYRDWVIDALNADMSFDQFTVEQLAGDLLPGAREAQRIATGFHANAPQAVADNIIKEEYRVKAVVDRVDVTGQVWMGLTLGCAECHDHKSDPISAREFYQLFAIFNQTPHYGEDWDVHGPRLEVWRWIDGNRKSVQAPVMADGEPRVTRVRLRGDYRQPGEKVEPGGPSFLPPISSGKPVDRLVLAKWLVDKRHPLTARVAVNRLWQHAFQRGLVATPNDFGGRGARPTHPELLDWLAGEFIGQGWSRKFLLRQLLASAAYRQSSQTDAAGLASDPENVWLARGPKRKLSAEELRDQALALGGLLERRLGGPSVFPPQPESVGAFRMDLAGAWTPSEGANAYRRSLYIFWQRMSPYPTLALLGAPSREVCVGRRAATSTPLQALVTLNEGAFHESAKSLADRIFRAPDARRLSALFRECLSREPTAVERFRFEQFLDRHGSAKTPRAWSLLTAVMLNLEEAQSVD